MNHEQLVTALEPISELIGTLDFADPQSVEETLNKEFPFSSELVQKVRTGLRTGIEAQTLCDRENAGVRFSRALKPSADFDYSIDLVELGGVGAGHTHPNGEISMCFSVSGDPLFDGNPEGWVVYGPGTWHEPTVEGGAMDFIYYLPKGAMKFGPRG